METNDALTTEYLQGKGVSEIARKYGVTRECVYQHLRELPDWEKLKEKRSLKRRRNKIMQDKRLKDQVIELKKQGHSTTSAADTLEIAYETAKRLLKGTQYDETQAAKEERNQQIRKEYKENNVTQQQLANKYGVSQQTISTILNTSEE
jgi:transposase-like protein